MFTFIDITNAASFASRVATARQVLKQQGHSVESLHAEFLAGFDSKLAGQDAWERIENLHNPTAAELRLYARVLRVNTTWLITGDVRFVPESMAFSCHCWLLPESMWTTHYGAVEPGSTHQYNPNCPIHGGEVTHAQEIALLDLIMNRKLPEVTGDLVPVAAARPTTTSEF